MANESRVRSNFQSGTITDSPLTNVATTISSPAFASLPVIGATQHLVLVLDPLATAGAPEIVYVTAHTASATSVTVLRAQEGTVARQHNSGTTWRHAAVASDFDPVLGYSAATTNQAGISTETSLTNCSVTVTVPYAGHRVRITGFCPSVVSTVANDVARVSIKESATLLQLGQATVPTAFGPSIAVSWVGTPTAASHTYNLTLTRVTGTGTLTSNADPAFPAYILVEDLGPAA